MRKLKILLFLLMVTGIKVVIAQQAVTGRVATADNLPLPGVTIVVKGTSVGTATDANGRFSISVPNQQSVLQFSFISFNTQEVTVGTQTNINVTLVESTEELDEVVITSLGIRREAKSIGYSTTTIKSEDLLVSKNVNVMESLEGKVAGLNITPPAAGAGASTQIRMRGQSAFAGGNNAPLLVINGLPIDQNAQGVNGNANMRDLGDNLNNLNPDDIESMTVLKGAAAAAIYGSRAANGAIIITTKSGSRIRGIGVEFSSSLTTQTALNYFDELQYEYGLGVGGNKPTTAGYSAGNGQFGWGARLDGSMVPAFNGVEYPYIAYKDKLFEYFRTGRTFTNTVAFSGGNENGSFRASFSNSDADGIDPFNEYKRIIANLGVNYDITEKLNFSVNVNYTNEAYINPPQIGTQGPGGVNFFTRIASSIPMEAIKDYATNPLTGTEAQTTGFQGTILNPYYAYQDAGQRFERKNDRFLGTATLRYDIAEWLYILGRYNYDYALSFTEQKNPGGIGTSVPINTSDGTYKGNYNVGEGWGTDINADFLLGASRRFGKFSVDASFGGNTFRVKDHNFNISASNFTVKNLYSIANGTNRNQSFDFSQYRVNSLYGIAEFGYNSMFYLNLTGREDWFSVLNPESNSKFYPSVSGSFVFSELLKEQAWFTFGKLRGSWAQVGSANGVNVYEGNLTYAIANNQFNGQTLANIAQGTAPNPNLQPFSVEEKEIGLEMRLFNNRLHIDIAAFEKVTTDQILNVQLSTTSGYNSSKKNLGSLKNSGVELTLEATPVRTNDFTWISSWNTSYLKTEVLSVGTNPDGTPIESLLLIYFNGTGNEFLGELRYTVGLPMNQLYTRTYARNNNGDIIVRSDGRLKASDSFLPVGSSIPKHIGGWTNQFTYKNLTLGVFIDYKLGGTVLSSTHLNLTRQGHTTLSLEGRRIFEDGTVEQGLVFPGINEGTGQPNTVAVTNLQGFYGDYRNLQIGDPFTFKSDFIKLRNISLTYNLTDAVKLIDFLNFVKGLSLTASCRNVAILYKDIINLDPEAIQSSGDMRSGYENSSLPTTRNFMFSLNAKF